MRNLQKLVQQLQRCTGRFYVVAFMWLLLCALQDARRERRYMVDFNESEGESAFLVVRSTKGVWFDNPHVFHRSLAKVPISFCFAEGAQVQTELGPTASVKVGGYFASSAEYEEWYQRRRASLTLPPPLGAEVRTFTPGSALSLRSPRLQTFTFLPRAGVRRQEERRREGGRH